MTFSPTILVVALAAGLTASPAHVPARTQISIRYSDGTETSTANAHESRPALSLIKLHLGYWVLLHGAPADKALVEDMIRTSDDGTASYLDKKYPQAIPEIISRHQLRETHYNGYWGVSTTSTHDLTRFLWIVVRDPAAEPLLRGMRTASPVSRDGYRQDFGTARIPGVWGSKFGWADDQDVHATVSFGQDFTVAATTFGSPADLTHDVLAAVRIVPQDTAPEPSRLERQILPLIPQQWRPTVRMWITAASNAAFAQSAR